MLESLNFNGIFAKALALREAISLTVTLSLPLVVVESDCQELVEACHGNIRRREIEQILKDIQNLKENFTWLGFLWTNRESNFAADLVAKLAATRSLNAN